MKDYLSRCEQHLFAYLGLLRVGFTLTQHLSVVAGELLPHRFTLTPCGAVYFCGTSRHTVLLRVRLPLQQATLLCGVRTFLPHTRCERLTASAMRN